MAENVLDSVARVRQRMGAKQGGHVVDLAAGDLLAVAEAALEAGGPDHAAAESAGAYARAAAPFPPGHVLNVRADQLRHVLSVLEEGG